MPRNRRSARSDGGSKSATALGLVLITIAVAAIAIGGYFYVNSKVKIDANGCLSEGESPLKLVILIDVTSKFSTDQVEALKGYAEFLFETLPRYAEVSVYRLSDHTTREDDRVIKVCSPGNPRDINQWTDNQKMVKKRWDTEFKGKIEAEIQALSSSRGGKSSPILESIRSVSLIEFKIGRKNKTRLTVISDFVENSGLLNMYRGNGAPAYQTFKASASYQYSRARLEDVDTDLLVLETDSGIQQDSAFQKFWENYLIDNGSANTRFRSLIRYGK
jgi:hypothetical protein